jgi:hypothetical protein
LRRINGIELLVHFQEKKRYPGHDSLFYVCVERKIHHWTTGLLSRTLRFGFLGSLVVVGTGTCAAAGLVSMVAWALQPESMLDVGSAEHDPFQISPNQVAQFHGLHNSLLHCRDLQQVETEGSDVPRLLQALPLSLPVRQCILIVDSWLVQLHLSCMRSRGRWSISHWNPHGCA